MITKTVAIEKIVLDEELYPRAKYDWQTAYDYSMSMKAGARFPPIVVAEYEGIYILIDGKHRIEGKKLCKEKTIKAYIKKNLTRAEIFVEATRLNIINGRPLSPYDKRVIIQKLRKMKFTTVQISEIICIPANKIHNFVAERVASTITGEDLILKAPLKNLVGQVITDDVEFQQKVLSAMTQEQVVAHMIILLQNNSFVRTPKMLNQLKIIRQLIGKFVMKSKGR